MAGDWQIADYKDADIVPRAQLSARRVSKGAGSRTCGPLISVPN